MTHDELLAKIDSKLEYCTCDGWNNCWADDNKPWLALRAVVELPMEDEYTEEAVTVLIPNLREQAVFHHKFAYRLAMTKVIQAIEKELV